MQRVTSETRPLYPLTTSDVESLRTWKSYYVMDFMQAVVDFLEKRNTKKVSLLDARDFLRSEDTAVRNFLTEIIDNFYEEILQAYDPIVLFEEILNEHKWLLEDWAKGEGYKKEEEE